MSASALIQAAEAVVCRPWLRHVLPAGDWAALIAALADEPLDLLALWADPLQVHALLLDQATLSVHAVSTTVEQGAYPAFSPVRPGASWYERMIRDLWGHEASGGHDRRSWLDHGRWPRTVPMGSRPGDVPGAAEPPEFLGEAGASLMQVPMGPIGGPMGLIGGPMGPIGGLVQDAAHLRLTMDGARILRAESRLGYTHKGTLSLMQGKSPRAAARFAARISADATVAHAIAFAQAAEAASDIEPPPRAIGLRAIMLEVERIAAHLATLAAVAEIVGAAGPRVTAERLRERVLGASETGFGHRLMMDCVVPGGVALDIAPEGVAPLTDALEAVAAAIAPLRRMVGGFAMATRLAGCARADPAMVTALAVGGVAGRAAGRRMDARMVSSLYADLDFAPAVDTEGDAASRCRVMLAEIAESLRLIVYLLRILPDGVTSVALPQVSGEGIGCAESARGDVWHWVRLDHGRIVSVFARDPGWALWPLAEAALVGASFDDVALTRASLALSVSGMDL